MEHTFLSHEHTYIPPNVPTDIQEIITYLKDNPDSTDNPPILICSPKEKINHIMTFMLIYSLEKKA